MKATSETQLVATTRRVAPFDDVLEQLGSDGFAWFDAERAIVTSGVAAVAPAAHVTSLLATIDGSGVIACGALPFAGTAAGVLTVPATIIRADGDETTITTIEPATPSRPRAYSRVPRRFTVESTQDLAAWDHSVAAALSAIDAKALRKVVLAREVLVGSDTPFAVPEVVATLRRAQPGCFVFADGTFVGATPELLVRRTGREVTARPMAGTVPRQASPALDDAVIAELMTSLKGSNEHRYVVEAVTAALEATCVDVAATAPEAVRLTNVTHLTTTVTARTRDTATTALDLALALHPTPAVGGSPTEAALATIDRLEPFSRGCYGAPVGWVDADGDGEFAVALRCAELNGTSARLLAGAGIVRGSDPDLEWAETQAKLEPMLRALIRP